MSDLITVDKRASTIKETSSQLGQLQRHCNEQTQHPCLWLKPAWILGLRGYVYIKYIYIYLYIIYIRPPLSTPSIRGGVSCLRYSVFGPKYHNDVATEVAV